MAYDGLEVSLSILSPAGPLTKTIGEKEFKQLVSVINVRVLGGIFS